MQFIMLLPAPPQVLEEFVPTQELYTAMNNFNEEMTKAGVLLSAQGLQPPSKGTRIRKSGGKKVVTDGPFAETKEVIAGFWIIEVNSKEEAVEWANRCPLEEGGIIEIRQIVENCTSLAELQANICAE